MWIYLVPLTISLILTNAILSMLFPKFKQKEEIENAFATENKRVYLDKGIKRFFAFFTFFCLVVGLILLFVPQLCETMEFNWLTTNIVCWSILLLDLIFLFSFLQVSHVEYNDDFMLITNIFRVTKKIKYSDIVRISSNIKIFTKKEKYFIPCWFFYGGEAFKRKITEKLNEI